MPSDFSILIDGCQLPVTVRRHRRAHVMRLRFDASGPHLKLTIPPHASLRSAQIWAGQQVDWVRTQMGKHAAPHSVGANSMLPWRDGGLRIEWQEDRPRRPELSITADGPVLRVGGPESAVGARVAGWLKAQAREEFARLTDVYAARAGRTHAGISIGDPRSRWGSCSSSGRIRYSWRIIMAPDFVRTALVAHEVAHLAHMHHGPAFHRLVDELVGDLAARSRIWLKSHGPSLHLLRFGRHS